MDASPEKPWSDSPYAPQIPYSLYFAEKANFAGILLGAIFYGIVIVLFFHCMSALLSHANRATGGVNWLLVAHTAAMFSFVTIYTAMNSNLQSISYIDNREFPGIDDQISPGPLGYQLFIYGEAVSVVPNIMFLLNNWLADGLLLYRCCIIYSMNYLAVAFPFLMYLASLAMGIMLVFYQATQPETSAWSTVALNFNYPYFTISLSLNILLTLMILGRLVLYARDVKRAVGTTPGLSGIYKAVVVVLVESSSLYALSFLLFIGPWGAKSQVSGIFLPILAETQVIAPFLITLRVADRSALTSTTVSGDLSTMTFAKRGKSEGDAGTLTGAYPMSPVETYGKHPSELGVAVETTINLHRDGVQMV